MTSRCVRIDDLKQKVKYHPEVGTYISEEDIDLAERVFYIDGVLGEWEGTPIGNCLNCSHAEEDFRESRKGWLNCPMWGAAGINPRGFCHMWKPKDNVK